MKVTLSWLREFTPDLGGRPEELAAVLSDLGLAVEAMERVGDDLEAITVARVVATRPHPDADKIQLVDVDPGDGQPIQVACGAFNFGAGDVVPLAPVGAVMPGGMEIGRRKMRGEWSNGMLCSAAELGLGTDHGGILVLDPSLEIGAPLPAALGIEGDVVYDLEVNPNRPDAMSVAGVARDLAARLGLDFSVPGWTLAPTAGAAPVGDRASVEVLDPDGCGRFVAAVLGGITFGPSPAWLATRLRLAGMRPISNVVDVSNYVMLELGQPSHPYDLALLAEDAIRVRRATEGEAIVTLDDVERTLIAADLLICDGDDAPIGIAGVMGGASTEISGSTTDVLVEMAWFDPMTVARTSKRLGLRSEASARFERGCDPEVIPTAMARFVDLLALTVPGLEVADGLIDEKAGLPDRPVVAVRTARVNHVLGTSLTGDQIASYLRPLGFEVAPGSGGGGEDGDVQTVTIPSYRPDSTAEIDVVEEVARLHGYQQITRTVPGGVRTGGLTPMQRARRRARDILVGLGIDEAVPTPFVAPEDVERCGGPLDEVVHITNPLVHEESVLRPTLLPGLMKALAYNQGHRVGPVSLFELATVFRRPPAGVERAAEAQHLGVALLGEEAPAAVAVLLALVDGLAVPGAEVRSAEVVGLHPTRTAEVLVAGSVVGAVGEVDPEVLRRFEIDGRVAWLEVDAGRLLSHAGAVAQARPVSRYPSSDIDLAFEVPDRVPAAEVGAALTAAGGDLLADVALFDVYRGEGLGEGRRSLAYRLRFQAPDRTLTDAEVAEARQRCITAVEEAVGATLRG